MPDRKEKTPASKEFKDGPDFHKFVTDIIRRQAPGDIVEDREQDMSGKICGDVCPTLKKIFEEE